MVKPGITAEHLRLLPLMLRPDLAAAGKVRLNDAYQHGGGWMD